MDVSTTLFVPSTGTGYGYYWEKVGDPATNSGNLNLSTILSQTGAYNIYIQGNNQAINMYSSQNSAKALTSVAVKFITDPVQIVSTADTGYTDYTRKTGIF